MMNSFKNFFTKSLMRQLIFGIAGVHAILMGMFVYDLVERQREFLMVQNTQQVLALAESLSAASTSWVLANDLVGIEEIIQSQSDYPELRYVMLLNMHGQVLGYSDRSKVGLYISDSNSQKLLTAAKQAIILIETKSLIDVAVPIQFKQQQIGWARVGLSRYGITHNLQLVTQKGIIYMLIAILVGVLFAWLMASGLTHAIRQLKDVIERTIVRQLTGTLENSSNEEKDPEGQLNLGSNLNRSDELGQLSHDFNLMQEAINYREQQLSLYQEKLSHILNSLDEGVLTVDENGSILMINTTAARLFTYAKSELLGQPISLVIPQVKLQQKINALQLEGLRKDKTLFPIRVSMVDLGEGDTTQQYLYSFQDIAEQLQQEQLLRRAQKMEAVGQLTGGIAHDFNNQLGVIQGYLSFLDESIKGKSAEHQWVGTATQATERCIQLSRQLLDFSRHREVQTEQLDLNQVLTEVRDIIERSITPQIQLHYDLSPKACLIKVNHSDLIDAILNIVINARDAMPQGGALSFQTDIQYIEESYTNLQPAMLAGNFVSVSITDTGGGIPLAFQERVFDPFFTTKAKGTGTGLGLSMVYSFAQRAKGQVTFIVEKEVGTCFKLALPFSEEVGPQLSIEAESQPKASVPCYGQGEKILVVDDEDKLRELAVAYLHKLGYKTVEAATAQDAIDILAKDLSIIMVFSDIIMPGNINGYQLAQHIVENYPQMKILLTSGFSGGARTLNSYLDFHDKLLTKPYTQNDLGQHVAALLNIQQGRLYAELASLHIGALTFNTATLDKEHKALQAILTQYKGLFESDNCSVQKISVLLQQLIATTKQHFMLEEWVLRVCRYPFYENHKQVHDIIIQSLELKVSEFLQQPEHFQHAEMLDFLAQSLVAHIINMDPAYVDHVKAHQQAIDSAFEQKK